MNIKRGDRYLHGSDGVVTVLDVYELGDHVVYENEMGTVSHRSLASFADEVEELP